MQVGGGLADFVKQIKWCKIQKLKIEGVAFVDDIKICHKDRLWHMSKYGWKL